MGWDGMGLEVGSCSWQSRVSSGVPLCVDVWNTRAEHVPLARVRTLSHLTIFITTKLMFPPALTFHWVKDAWGTQEHLSPHLLQ